MKACPRLFVRLLALVIFIAFPAWGHPPPETVVTGYFDQGKDALRLEIEVDARCLLVPTKAEEELYVYHWYLQRMTDEEKEAWIKGVRDFIEKTVEFRLLPAGAVKPRFAFAFTTLAGQPLGKLDDPIMLRGTWEGPLPEGLTGFQIKALAAGEVAVLFHNRLDGKAVERISSLFPGEESFVLDVSAYAPKPAPKLEVGKASGTLWIALAAALALLGGVWWLRRGARTA